MVSEASGDGASGAAPSARFESLGLKVPGKRLSSEELMASTKHKTRIELERLTGIHERHIVSGGEDSLKLAIGAAQDCLEHSRHSAADIEMLISCSISKYTRHYQHRLEPPLSLYIKEEIGAPQALNFDVSNACAGMATGVFLLNNFIRRGEIKRGMVVSGEDISQLGVNAAKQVRTVLSKQLASLTLGDAGAAVMVEAAPEGAPGIDIAGFTTLAKHSRLCLAYPSMIGPGASMYTNSRGIQSAAIADAPYLIREALEQSGLEYGEIDYSIPHQTSARAIRKARKAFAERLGDSPKETIINVEEFGNTSSTTHFVALYRNLKDGRFAKGDRIMLLALASGLEIGVIIFTMDDLVERYGHAA